MNPSEDLLTKAEQKLMFYKKGKFWGRIKCALEDYMVACDLSQGRVPSRNEHWKGKAKERETKLVVLVGK